MARPVFIDAAGRELQIATIQYNNYGQPESMLIIDPVTTKKSWVLAKDYTQVEAPVVTETTVRTQRIRRPRRAKNTQLDNEQVINKIAEDTAQPTEVVVQNDKDIMQG